MVTTDLGACEWFVWDLRRSNLLDRGQLDQIIGEFLQKTPGAEPPALADFLTQKSILTKFQADRLLQGKTQGFVMGPFTLMDALGAGSMGTVYKAQNKTDGKWYAVKVLPRRSMWNVRIARRKVRAFEQCRHPSVVPFVDVGTAGGMHYLAWPYVEGDSLDKFVAERGKLPHGLTAHLALQMAEALDLCHQQTLIHGLLKPSNVMVGKDGQQLSILDFGIGCLLAETEGESLVDTMSTANAVASGLDCASPESIMDPSNLTPAGDQYSLGCVLYFMLSGQVPFPDGSAAEQMMAHQFKQPQPLAELSPDVPAALVAVVERLMQKAPEKRYGSTGELVESLRPLVPASVAPLPPPVRTLSGREVPASRSAKVQAPAKPEPTSAVGWPKGPVDSHPPRSVGPSTPTPRPATGSLPSRGALRGEPPSPKPAAKPAAKPPVDPPLPRPENPNASTERVIPGAILESRSLLYTEGKVGPLGVAIFAVAACAVVWIAAAWLF